MRKDTLDLPWVPLEDAAKMLGVTHGTAKNKIANGTFEVPHYKLGKRIVVDRQVLEEFFAARRRDGFRALGHSTND